jgi:DNA-directed RNA polymerase subunit RPC12/RpoP
MSEFKYACPVCGQHMMCDESHAGSVMDCPTCFQKIVAPQAPAPGSKFILTGTKLTDKKITAHVQDASIIEPKKTFPATLAIAIILGFMAAAAGVIYWTTIIHPRRVAKEPPAVNRSVAKPKEPPSAVAPMANNAFWSLAPTNAIPETPAAGRIHGENFIVERATFSTNGVLTLRSGTRGQFEFGIAVHFPGAQPESLAGHSLNVAADVDEAARVQLRWKDATNAAQKADFTNGYALRLEFGALLNNRLPGKIHLCTPDAEKSYVLGSFIADARKPRPKK